MLFVLKLTHSNNREQICVALSGTKEYQFKLKKTVSLTIQMGYVPDDFSERTESSTTAKNLISILEATWKIKSSLILVVVKIASF